MELTNEFTVDVGIDEAWVILTDVERIAPCMPGAQLQEANGDEYLGVVKVKVGPITAEYKGKATFLERDEVAHKAVLKAEGRETRGQGNASAIITAQLESQGSSTRVQVRTDLTISGRVAQFGRGVMADVTNKLLGQFVDCLASTVVAGSAGAAGAAAEPADDPAAGQPADHKAAAAPTGKAPAKGETAPAKGAAAKGSATVKAAGVSEGATDDDEPAAAPAKSDSGASAAKAADRPAPTYTEPAALDLMSVAGPALAKRLLVPVLNLVGLVLVWKLVRRKRQGRAAK